MKTLRYCLLLWVAGLALTASWAQSRPTCAVLRFYADEGVNQSSAEQIGNVFSQTLQGMDRYDVLPQSEIDRILQENEFSDAAYDSPQRAAVSAGKLLKADFVVIGRCHKTTASTVLTTRLIDTGTGNLISVARTDTRGGIHELAEHGISQNAAKLLNMEGRLASRPAAPPTVVEPEPPLEPAPEPAAMPEPKPETISPHAVPSVEAPPRLTSPPVRQRVSRKPLSWPKGISPAFEGTWVTIRERDMDEKGGVEPNPAYKSYRIASDRLLFSGGVVIGCRHRIMATAGMANLSLHASEGQTREFAWAPLFGLSYGVKAYRFPHYPAEIVVTAGYRFFKADDDDIESVSEHLDFLSWESLSVDWEEMYIAPRVNFDFDRVQLSGGVQYTQISADESGSRQGTGFSGELDQDSSLGLLTGARYRVTDNTHVRAEVQWLDQTAFILGVECQL